MKVRTALLLTLLAEGAIAALGVFEYGSSIEALQATTRFSGRLSLFIFSFIFLLYPQSRTSLPSYFSGKYFLVFAFAHGIHLLELLSYVYLAGIELVPYRVAGGFLAYSMIFAMPWFQGLSIGGKISPMRFQTLGYVYLFYVWLIFFMTYVSRVNGSFPNAGGSHLEHVILMGWVCVMLGIKLWQCLRKNLLERPARLLRR